MYSSSTCFKSSTVSKIYRSIWEAWRTLVSAELCWIPILIKLAVLLLKHSELGYFPFSRSLFYHCLYDCTIQIIHDDIIKFLNVLFFFFFFQNWTVHGLYWGSYKIHRPVVLEDSIRELLSWVAKGRITIHISHTYSLSEVQNSLFLSLINWAKF
jgi:hypothetical protein